MVGYKVLTAKINDMIKNQEILKILIKKGYTVKGVAYWPTYGFRAGGWIALVIEKDEDNDEIEQDYFLGKDFIEARKNIENNQITKL